MRVCKCMKNCITPLIIFSVISVSFRCWDAHSWCDANWYQARRDVYQDGALDRVLSADASRYVTADETEAIKQTQVQCPGNPA